MRRLIVILMALIACTPAAAAQPAEPIPAEAFASLPFFFSPEISPDGRKIVAKSVTGDRTIFLLADLADEGFETRQVPMPEKHHLL